MRPFWFIPLLMIAGCSTEREDVYREYRFCSVATGKCYTVEMVLFVRSHSYWEPGSTAEEVIARAYRIDGPEGADLESRIAYCKPQDQCFVRDTRLAICNRQLTLRTAAASSEGIFGTGCEMLERKQ